MKMKKVYIYILKKREKLNFDEMRNAENTSEIVLPNVETGSR